MTESWEGRIGHLGLRKRVADIAGRYDLGVRLLASGHMISPGYDYAVLQNRRTGQVKLIAVQEHHYLATKPGTDEPAHADQFHTVAEFDGMPSFWGALLGGHIDLDRARSSDFMVHSGNLMELPANGGADFYFQNDFATYAAIAKEEEGKPVQFDLYGYFTDGRPLEEQTDTSYFKWLRTQIEKGSCRGIYLKRVEGRLNAEKAIHGDYCLRFSRLLESRSPLSIEDVRHNFWACARMIAGHHLSSSIRRPTVHDGFEWAHYVVLLIEPISAAIRIAQVAWDLGWKLMHAEGGYLAALLPPTHPSHPRKRFPVEEASEWRILDAEKAGLHKIGGSKIYDSIAQAWNLEEKITVISNTTPCLIKEVGHEVISVQEPNGSKLFVLPDGRVFSVYLPDRQLLPVLEVDPNMYRISDRFKDLYKSGQAACLELKNQFSAVAGAVENSYQVTVNYVPLRDAYRTIGEFAKCDGKKLFEADRPGDVAEFRPTRTHNLESSRPAA